MRSGFSELERAHEWLDQHLPSDWRSSWFGPWQPGQLKSWYETAAPLQRAKLGKHLAMMEPAFEAIERASRAETLDWPVVRKSNGSYDYQYPSDILATTVHLLDARAASNGSARAVVADAIRLLRLGSRVPIRTYTDVARASFFRDSGARCVRRLISSHIEIPEADANAYYEASTSYFTAHTPEILDAVALHMLDDMQRWSSEGMPRADWQYDVEDWRAYRIAARVGDSQVPDYVERVRDTLVREGASESVIRGIVPVIQVIQDADAPVDVARAALACVRYRNAAGRWPASLGELGAQWVSTPVALIEAEDILIVAAAWVLRDPEPCLEWFKDSDVAIWLSWPH